MSAAEPGRRLPTPRVEVELYSIGPASVEPRLRLDRNEGRAPRALGDLVAALGGTKVLERYPDDLALRERLAARYGVAVEQVRVFAGLDEALDRLCRAYLGPGRSLLTPAPTFEMLPRYVALAGGELRTVDSASDRFPLGALLAAAPSAPTVLVVVSPNNPTGAAGSRAALTALYRAFSQSLLVLDAAYDEFADEPLADFAAGLEGTLVLRTFSKARGLAGLRVGFAIGPAEVVEAMHRAGSPYPVGGLSLELANRALDQEEELRRAAQTARVERSQLAEELGALGAEVNDSQGNFLTFRVADGDAWFAALAAEGVALRRFPARPGWLRLTCPLDASQCLELRTALRRVGARLERSTP